MKKFQFKLLLNGKIREILVDAISQSKAKELLNLRYGKSISFVDTAELR